MLMLCLNKMSDAMHSRLICGYEFRYVSEGRRPCCYGGRARDCLWGVWLLLLLLLRDDTAGRRAVEGFGLLLWLKELRRRNGSVEG